MFFKIKDYNYENGTWKSISIKKFVNGKWGNCND